MRMTRKRRTYETVRRLGISRPCLLVSNGDLVQEATDFVEKLIMREIVPIQRMLITYNFGGKRRDLKRLNDLLKDKFGKSPLSTIHALAHKVLTRFLRKTLRGNAQPYVVTGSLQEEIARAAMGMAGIDLQIDKLEAFLKKVRGAKAHLFYPPFMEADDKEENEFFRFFEAYEKLLRQKRAYDYDDLIGHAFSILRDNPWLLEEFRFKFRYIIAYNYQQLTYAQKCFLALLSGQGREIGFYAVGSDDYHLSNEWYSWKDAINEFRKDYPLGEIVIGDALSHTTRQIALAAYNIIKNKKKRIEKNDLEFIKKLPDGANICTSVSENAVSELRFVLNEVQMLYKAGVPPQDIALIFYNPKYIGVFARLLKDLNIPYCGQIKRAIGCIESGVFLSSLNMIQNQFFDYVFLVGVDSFISGEVDSRLNSLFIGMTRSRKKLYITMAKERKSGRVVEPDTELKKLFSVASDQRTVVS